MTDLNKTVSSLERRHFKVKCFDNDEEAKQAILDMIPKNKTIGAGGSKTLIDIGVLDALRERGNTVFSVYLADKYGENNQEARSRGISADYYLTSTNAVTENGEIYNTDGGGNRVASMFYGPETVIIVAGKNKIVKNLNEAKKRMKSVAAPLNTERLNCDTPCAKSGKCEDCDSEDRICRITVILEWVPKNKDIYVFLVNEDLGF